MAKIGRWLLESPWAVVVVFAAVILLALICDLLNVAGG